MKISKMFVLACSALLFLLAACGSPPVDPTTNRLTVNLAGTGSGSVTITPNGGTAQTVTANTTKTFETGTRVTLSATPAAGSTFDGFTGGSCTGTGNCTVTVSTDTTVTATFTEDITPPPPGSGTVSAAFAGDGTGTVTLTPDSGDPTACTTACTETYEEGTVVTVTATADAGSTFDGFSGDCTAVPCTVTVGDGTANSVTATFGEEDNGGPTTETVTASILSTPDGFTANDGEEFITDPTSGAAPGAGYVAGTVATYTNNLDFFTDFGASVAIGLRFEDLDIPQGADITEAYVTFVASADNGGSLSMSIQGQAAANPGAFVPGESDAANPKTPTNDITNRVDGAAGTTATVAWDNVPAWVTDESQQSPDISSIVEEIVGLGDWDASDNAVVLVLEKSAGTSTRKAYDLRNGTPASLTVTYTVPAP